MDPTGAKEIALSLVIPCYRDAARLERHLPLLVEYLEALELAYEVIVVDDGSADAGATRAVAERCACACVALPRNRGKGAAVRLGMAHAQGRVRLFTDADVPYQLDAIPRAWSAVEETGADVVVGDRHLAAADPDAPPPLSRRLASPLFAWVAGRLAAGPPLDTQCGFKAFRAEAADALFPASTIDGFAADVEILLLARDRGLTILRLPVQLRAFDGSSVHPVRDGLAMLRDVARIAWRRRAGRLKQGLSPAEADS